MWIVKKIIWIVTLLMWIVLFSGCSKKWCTEHYPCIDSTSYRELVKVDTAWFKLPADTTYIELPFDCPDQQIIYKEGKKETKIVVRDRKIYINQITAADSAAIINLFKQSSEFKQAVKEVEVPKLYVPNWLWLTLTSLIILLIFAYRKAFFNLIRFFS